MKRFTETDKWRDSWFRKLSAEHKLAYLYALDNCDAAGVWEADYELAEFVLGCAPNWTALLESLGDRVAVIRGGKWHLTRFIAYQYGALSEDCKPHQHVVKVLKSHSLSIPYAKGIYTLKEKEKEKDKEQDKETDTEKDTDKQQGIATLRRRFGAMFGKRESTPWDKSELKAWEGAKALAEAMIEAEWALLESFYAAKESGDQKLFRRTTLAVLLNNLSGEIDKARKWASGRSEFAHAF
jgi:hypothetical protein